jgi:hypothetical protein
MLHLALLCTFISALARLIIRVLTQWLLCSIIVPLPSHDVRLMDLYHNSHYIASPSLVYCSTSSQEIKDEEM